MPTRPPTQDDSCGGWSDPGVDPGAAPAVTPPVHRYALGAVLGEGGMGVVHAARDQSLGRDVALKELKAARAGDAAARLRLAREAAITSRLDHPGIVAVHDVGTLADGRPYYTMRLVRGRSLADASREADAGSRRGLVRHLLAAAEAVAAAHQAGIVHRDLKPSNILVGAYGETQVVDWGLAAPTREAEARWSGLPGASARGPVGTDRFMSPEQGAGAPPDPRDDVYSLGVTLREVLGLPLDAELAAIAARATAAPAGARYPDAGALAADLLAWFEGRRVAAHAYSAGELLRRAWSAYRLPLTVGGVGLSAVAVAVGIGWAETASALERALHAESRAADSLAEVQLERAVEAARAGQRERAERLALAVLQRRDDPVARGVFAAFGRAERPAMLADRPAPDCLWSVLPPGGGWVLCATEAGLARHEAGATRWSQPGSFRGAELHGDQVLAWDPEMALVALDAGSGAVTGRWPRAFSDWTTVSRAGVLWDGAGPLAAAGLPPSGCQGRIQVSRTRADGRIASLCDDGTLYLGDATDPGRIRVRTQATGEHVATAIGWKPDGGLLIGTVRGRVLDLDPAGQLRSSADTDLGLLSELVVTPDGRHAGLRGAGGRVGLWRVDTATLDGELDADAHSLVFSDEGLVVHTRGSGGSRLHTWRLPAAAPAVLRGRAGLSDATASADGARLALVGGDGYAAVADLRDGAVQSARMGARVVKAAAFAADGVWFTGMDQPWAARLQPDSSWLAAAQPVPMRRLAALSDGSVVGARVDRGVHLWPAGGGARELVLPDVTIADMERDGDRLVLLDSSGRVWRWVDGAFTPEAQAHPEARAVAIRGEALYLASAERVTDGVRSYAEPGASLIDVAVSPDGRRLAASALDGRVFTWDTHTGALLLVLAAHRERAVSVEFLPDGDLVSASWDGTARIADLDAIDTPVAELAAAVVGAWGPE